MTRWYEQAEADKGVIISSRIRLARNLKNHPFPGRMNETAASGVIEEIKDSVINERTAAANIFVYEELSGKPREYLQELLERHIISPEMAAKTTKRGLLLSGDESVSVMINEEDHARIQAIYAGDEIDTAYSTADKIDNLIEESANYAFDPEFGYLTACPTNTGTGMRASFMLHIPALEQTGNLQGFVQAVSKFGIAVRGIHGEGSESAGSIYQISNQTTLGKPENDIIATLKNVTKQIIEQEEMLRDKILTDLKTATEDRIYRAYGILKNSRILRLQEAMAMLSDVRVGYIWGILDPSAKPKMTIYNLMMEIQHGSIAKRLGRQVDEGECDVFRAEFVRGVFGG